MIVYRSTKKEFQREVEMGSIDLLIEKKIFDIFHKRTAPKEVDSWWNSLHYMSTVLNDPEIPDDVGVAIECQIPQTSKRIDFVISGMDDNNKSNIVIVELKQWKTAEITEKDGIVRTALGKGLHETSHPSYQAWSYAALMQDYNEAVRDGDIGLNPCAYLHNYVDDLVIRNSFYSEYLEKAPVFLKRDPHKLRDFIKRFVKVGDKGEILYQIERGKIRPSKQLSESLSSLLKGNHEFIMIDDQKLVYETALWLTERSKVEGKKVLIVEGGPGTGKSVVAINLLVEITKREMLTQYITKNAAPRAVYQSKLTGSMTKSRFSALFQSSGVFVNGLMNEFDTLIVDEAHRLNEKSGMFQNKGENQVMEIIRSARCSVFFIDENQKVSMKDIGTKEEIKKQAKRMGAVVQELELNSQFRCNGSDAYLAFLDNLLQIRATANPDLDNVNYDFRVCETPTELRELIFEKNKEKNSARIVAGYCWDWKSQKNPNAMDIVFPQHDFEMKWNLAIDSMLWIMKPDSVNEIGCIHTCQGLELDYIGVIIGSDLIFRNGEVLVDPSKRSKMDSSIKGYKKMLVENPEKAKNVINAIIKNTYRTLMTRGMKGCYIWSEDLETREWLKSIVVKQS
ncbi:MAG: DUF2075 domain-containing protein [Bacteroidota bacterium]|nr:DUF2075 domain-containing protein [Bacteroidota bacterium]